MVSHQCTMLPLGNVNTHSTWGQASSDWLGRPCKERYFGVPFIYSGQWKINMPVKSILKNEWEVSHLTKCLLNANQFAVAYFDFANSLL